jgi:molybdopterin-guanine dinucleotide biosynthesis protein A
MNLPKVAEVSFPSFGKFPVLLRAQKRADGKLSGIARRWRGVTMTSMSLSSPHPLSAGLILAGGRSSRFGSDKAAAMIDGLSLLERAADGLRSFCQAIAVSAPADSVAAGLARDLKLEVLSDRRGDPAGPLAGIRAGLEWAQGQGVDRLAVRPVDTPLVSADIFDELARMLGAAPAAYCVTPDGPQPLCALWTFAALPRLNQILDGHSHPPVFRLLDNLGAVRVPVSEARAFVNFNTPAELAAAYPKGVDHMVVMSPRNPRGVPGGRS